MLREGFSTMRWRRFSRRRPPSALARPKRIRRQKKMPVSKLRLMRGTTSTFKSKSLLRKTLAIADIIIATCCDEPVRVSRRYCNKAVGAASILRQIERHRTREPGEHDEERMLA